MNQPPRTGRSVRRPPAQAPRRRAPSAPPPRRRIPWVSLTIWGLLIGVGAGIYIQITRWLQPMFDMPPAPPFLAETPLGSTQSSASESDASDTDDGSDADTTASNSDSADSSSESSDSADVELASSSISESTTDAPADESDRSQDAANRGRVIEPIGLAIRADPSIEAAYLGGLAFNETVTILESSGDGRWQRVRRDFNGLEGWIKAGNIVEIDE